MGTLVANVHVPGHGWFGPAHGNAEGVPVEVAALISNPRAWDEVPEQISVVTPQEQSLTGNGGGEASAESQAGSPGAAQAGAGGDAPATGDEITEVAAPSLLEQLGRLPDDKDVLAGFAQAQGIEVDGRKGPAKLRAEIAEALAAKDTP